MDRPPDRRRTVTTWIVAGALLVAPFVAMLWTATYAKQNPELWGIPFFYWYQMLWVIITAILTIIAYHLVRRIERPGGRVNGQGNGGRHRHDGRSRDVNDLDADTDSRGELR